MITKIDDGLVKVTGTAAMYCGLWTRCTLRKPKKCELTGRLMGIGRTVYRPITNTVERGQRVNAEVMEKHLD